VSVVLITHNEEANLARTLASVQSLVADGQGEIIIVDSHSTDRTVDIAKSYNAKVFTEDWKGFAAQKNSAIDKAQGDWILSLDADEEAEPELANEIAQIPTKWNAINAIVAPKGYNTADIYYGSAADEFPGVDFSAYSDGFFIRRKNFFLGRWMKHGGYWPDPKLRLFRRRKGNFPERQVHETAEVHVRRRTPLRGALLHHSYPTISDYIEHMNRYSSLGAEMALAKGPLRFPVLDIFFRPVLTFLYNYIFRLGFLDGHEGFLLHVNHAIYVSWKYAKAWELEQTREEALTSENNTAQ
jgi:glycosyltransferase involved in cell wall biosynthesis